MRTFLCFMLIVMVSGDGERVDVTTFLNEDVLLQCNCTNRNLEKDFRWQIENGSDNKNNILVDRGRVETFNSSNPNNCSIRLKNVTEDEHKTYRCWFYIENAYQYKLVNLRVCGPKPCQHNFTQPNGVKIFTCDVKSRDSTTGLLWTLDGEQLENSSKYKISSSSIQTDGIFHVTSTLQTNLTETNSSSVIKCNVTNSTKLLEISAPPGNTESKTGMLIGLFLVIGLIMLVVFIYLRKQRNICQMARCCMDVEKNVF